MAGQLSCLYAMKNQRVGPLRGTALFFARIICSTDTRPPPRQANNEALPSYLPYKGGSPETPYKLHNNPGKRPYSGDFCMLKPSSPLIQYLLCIKTMKRIFDFILAVFILIIVFIPILIIALAVRLASPGPVLYWSERVGLNNHLFKMPKFRSMKVDTPEVATHLLTDPHSAITPLGYFLRKTSLDELPQLWNILKGEMSFVGPRPALFNQQDLISLRTKEGIHTLIPGLTGWAQINGRDELPIPEKVKLDAEYMQNQSFFRDLYILWLTLFRVVNSHGVKH